MTQKNTPKLATWGQSRGTSEAINQCPILPETPEQIKQFETLRAQFALHGYAVRRVEFIGGYFASCTVATFYCKTLQDLQIVWEGLQS